MNKLNLSELYKLYQITLLNDSEWKYMTKDTQWHVDVLEEGEVLRFIFRKSTKPADWRDNFKFWFVQPKRPYDDMPYTFRAHKGFTERYKHVRSQVHDYIKEHQPKRVEVFGYSLGGAIATLCHEDLKFHQDELEIKEIETYTFASPRVFSWGIPKERFEGLHRIYLFVDLVSFVPFVWMLFRHVQEHKYRIVANDSWRIISNHYPEEYTKTLKALISK